MAQRGTASSKKAEAVAPAFASVTAADIIRAPVTQKTIPLDLAPLLVPHKRQGRLSLRVERVPQRAKLSAGRNNGDGTWSLASDELEDLNYLVPSNLSGGHELSIRIVSFDNSTAQTLKVIPLVIPPWDNDADAAVAAVAENVVRSSAEAHDPILHNELSKMQSLFAVRDSDLAELRAALKQANAQKEIELAAARAAWEAELKQRLAEAAAQAKAETDKERLAWQTERHGQGTQIEALIQEKCILELNRSKAELDQRLEAERKHWQAQTEHAIGEARDRLKVESDQQLEAERKHWQAQAEQELTEERARAKAEIEQQLESERQHLQVQAEQRIADELGRLKAGTDQRLDTERQQWQAQAERIIAEERARASAQAEQRVEAERRLWEAQASNNGEVERHRLLAETGERLAAEQKRWQDQAEERLAAERQRWQSESDQRLEAERQNGISSSLAAASEAEIRWKSEEAVRVSAALAEWQQQSARQLAVESDKCRKLEAALAAALAAPASAANADAGGAQTERLRQELLALQGALPERDREIAQLREAMNQQRARQEADAAQATQAWKAEEAARIEALVANARAESQGAIAAATARAENAERALAQAAKAAEAQGQPAADAPRWDDGYVEGLRRDISTLRAALVNREVELGHARAALDQARVQPAVQRPGNAPIRRFPGPSDEPQEAPRGAKSSFVRDFAIMACVLLPAILGYPYVAAYLPDGVRSGISTVTGGLLSVRVEPAPVPSSAAAPVPVAPRPTASVARAANVRNTPATTGAVLATLPRDAVVVVLQTSGNWTQVEVPAKDATGKPQQGWMFSTFLKSAAVAAKPANQSTVAKPVAATAAAKPVSASAAVNPENVADQPASVAVKPEDASAAAEPQSASAVAEPVQ